MSTKSKWNVIANIEFYQFKQMRYLVQQSLTSARDNAGKYPKYFIVAGS